MVSPPPGGLIGDDLQPRVHPDVLIIVFDRARHSAPITLSANPAGCSLQFNLIGGGAPLTACDLARGPGSCGIRLSAGAATVESPSDDPQSMEFPAVLALLFALA